MKRYFEEKKTSYKLGEDISDIYPGDIRNHKLIKMITQQKTKGKGRAKHFTEEEINSSVNLKDN